MAIIKILVEFVIMFVCSIIQVIGIIVEGIAMFFGKIADYLCIAYSKLMGVVKKTDRSDSTYTTR